MSIFLLLYLTIYGFIHYFLLRRCNRLLLWRSSIMKAGIFFALAMVIAPISSRMLGSHGMLKPAHLCALFGYGWMGFVFLAFFLAVITDLICVLLGRLPSPGLKSISDLRPKQILLLPFVCAALLFIYGLKEAGSLTTETVTINTAKLPKGTSISIALISDVHIGLMNGREKITRLTKRIAELNPDVLVSAGDLIDGPVYDQEEITSLFSSLKPALGKFAVLGNHEYYAGLDYAIGMHKKAGFYLLRDRSLALPGGVMLTGIDDASPAPHLAFANEVSGNASAASANFRIVIRHKPENRGTAGQDMDLQLSGHTHGGQIFPFSFVTKAAFPLPTGLVSRNHEGALYHSRGSGTWGPMIRILSPPEVTMITIRGGGT